jgi:phage shock protein E
MSVPWSFLIVVVPGLAMLVWMRTGQVSAAQAKQLLAAGARVVDVRTPGEFGQDSVAGAVNIPLSALAADVPRRFPDRDVVLLLHCLSGGRSRIGCRKLKALGYRRVYNLGSVSRARSLVGVAGS